MKRTTFFDHYRIATGSDGAEDGLNRSGSAANYRAVDTRTRDTVALQLLPVPSVDPAIRDNFEERGRIATRLDHVNIARVLESGVEGENLVVVSEYLEGETADSWIAANGPMPADAVLRIGLQVVRALGAAMFHGIAHRAIQPSNLLIVPGESPDGGWPFIKLLNFGLAGTESRVENEKNPAAAVQTQSATFASPEQLVGRPIDFRSEIYSLGATMCFLLTGAVPLAVSGMKARLRARRLPELRRAPKSLRNLLVHMLRENPDNRPQDPVAFEAEMRDCLTKLERRQAIGRKFGIPLGVVVPARAPRSVAEQPLTAQIVRGFVAVAALLLAAAVVGAFLLPEDAVPFLHARTAEKKIGVPVGVQSDVPPNAVRTANAPQPSAAQAAVTVAPPNKPVAPTVAAAPAPSVNQVSSPVVANNIQATPANPPAQAQAEPAAPAEGPAIESSDNSNRGAETNSFAGTAADAIVIARNEPEPPDSSTPPARKPVAGAATSRRSTSKRIARVTPPADNGDEIDQSGGPPPPRVGRKHVAARVLGIAPDGRLIMRLPSGKIVTAYPRNGGEPRRRVIMSRRPPFDPDAPYQPFN